jgi:regulator of CtrA degradation
MAQAAFFLESTYQEAYDLLIESRDYIEKRIPEVRRHSSHAYKMVISVETMRLTTRLTQVMAWLLTQKAVHLEELSPQQAAKHAYRLGGQKICLDRGRVDYEILPIQLRKLLERSHGLYVRIHRLDQQLVSAAD